MYCKFHVRQIPSIYQSINLSMLYALIFTVGFVKKYGSIYDLQTSHRSTAIVDGIVGGSIMTLKMITLKTLLSDKKTMVDVLALMIIYYFIKSLYCDDRISIKKREEKQKLINWLHYENECLMRIDKYSKKI